jgi:hypothetical protein
MVRMLLLEPFQNSRISFKENKGIYRQWESIIYEATFQYNGVLVSFKILVKDEEGLEVMK